jgi:hypothetical protein
MVSISDLPLHYFPSDRLSNKNRRQVKTVGDILCTIETL